MGHIRNLCIIGGLGLLLACGGSSHTSSSPSPAKGFAYADPPSSTTSWRFVKNAATTSTHLVLDLVPPSGATGRGVGFTLQADGKVTWAKVDSSDAELVKPNGAVYDLGTGTQALLALVKSSALTVGVYQKGQGSAKTYDGSTAVLSVAMDFDTAAGLKAGADIPLRVEKISHLPASGTPTDIKSQTAMGTLTAQ